MYKMLEEMRILDLTRLLPGGYATQILADLGADVLKVEDPWQGDYLRWMKPHLPGTQDGAYYWTLNRNKKSVILNLKTVEGREDFLKLLREYDIVVEGFRPGVMEKLGLGYQVLQRANPTTILCSISGYGQDGPYRLRSGHDLNYLALAGALSLNGARGGPPVPPAVQVADIGGGGLMAVIAILTAHIARARTGLGQHVDVSMLDGVVSWMAMVYAQLASAGGGLKRGEGPLSGGDICYAVYETADGRYMSLAALEPKFWQAFCTAVERPDLIEKQFTRDPAARREVEKIFRARTQAEWVSFVGNLDICCEPVLEPGETAEHPQVKARKLFLAFEHPGGGSVTVPGRPLKFQGEKEYPDSAPPGFGEQTGEILSRLRLEEESASPGENKPGR
ncbi:CoA-transferase family III domain protein [Acididesulfobacillus acetoxydans]|uniref:Alpha-methylacyl-CoA racemase n=1 Tax=Acididesulfobacillus acetoxydans TaxID=1561005 RepID=A0A8S0VWW0_9FIRM|nr:CaiB/BaiF CoA-transferase family protein [Acididesulfobacillus acetoxydans]CAA7601293.1 CoA-transferase family III domain protein [Acididesulfobacillus acetoxydans]CEJ08797.1 Alpha-methylacyl-CoA racemase [Acididesulfobacillus acetoxydans]